MQITINFYKLFLEELKWHSISLICSKIMEQNEKVVIFFESEEEMKFGDDKLWTFSQSEFMPHLTYDSSDFEEFKEEVPILLTCKKENLIDAENLIILKKPNEHLFFNNYKKVFFIFSNELEDDLFKARQLWKEISVMKDFKSTFYEQGEDRKWQLKA